MCGRFAQQRPTSELARIFAAEALEDDQGARYNVAPTDRAAVVVEHGERRAVTAYSWGLVPAWAADRRIGSRLINARAETIFGMPAFRDAIRRRRCLVPVDAFYEWQRSPAGRQPYAIRRTDGMPLAFAGLWASWRDPASGERLRSFTIVTTAANERIAMVHDRMPVVIPPDDWDDWLDPALLDADELRSLLVPAPSAWFEVYPVSRLVNSVRNDGPELLVPVPAPATGADQPIGA